MLLKASEAIDDIIDAVESAAHELVRAGESVSHGGSVRATAVVRDLVRTTMAAVPRLEDPPMSREALHARVHEL